MSETDSPPSQSGADAQMRGTNLTRLFPNPAPMLVTFDRQELREILGLYGRMVASGEWRDYAMDFSTQRAVFAVHRRSSETPLYRIEKDPRHARRQGAYAVIAAGGLILRRGPDLKRVISVLEKRPKLVGV